MEPPIYRVSQEMFTLAQKFTWITPPLKRASQSFILQIYGIFSANKNRVIFLTLWIFSQTKLNSSEGKPLVIPSASITPNRETNAQDNRQFFIISQGMTENRKFWTYWFPTLVLSLVLPTAGGTRFLPYSYTLSTFVPAHRSLDSWWARYCPSI